MRCIFCKKESGRSKSVEHILPEALGNDKSVLPRGIVCDSCNNYFATNIENRILESEEFSYLRQRQLIPTKKGRPPLASVFFNNIKVKAGFDKSRDGFAITIPDNGSLNKVKNTILINENGTIKIPISGRQCDQILCSRWLAKMALEAMVFRVMDVDGWDNYIINDTQLDPIRNYARAPKKKEYWVFSRRRIYSEDRLFENKYQIMNEWDILSTGTVEHSEWYFVLAIFGIEYAINYAGPSIDGYNYWIQQHDGLSPLYTRKNIDQLQ